MGSLKDYYLDSLSELKVDGWLYRTGGSAQLQCWYSHPLHPPPPEFIKFRQYFKGKFRGKQFFAKQFLEPNLSDWTIKQSVEYQFQNLLLFEDMPCVPNPLFLTSSIVGMEFVEGKTIKELAMNGKSNRTLVEQIIAQIRMNGPIIIERLRSLNRLYDCSYNNILVKEDGAIMFVDFDYVHKNLNRSISKILRIVKAMT